MANVNSHTKPKPLDLSHHFSRMARRRKASSVASIVKAVSSAEFQAGPCFPFAGNFPVDTLEGAIADKSRYPLHPAAPLALSDSDTATRFTVPKVDIGLGSDSKIDLKEALQYHSSTGISSLADFLQDWAINHQNQGRIPYEGPQTLLTGGTLDALAKCMMTFADEGDSILMEENIYFSARDLVLPFGVKVVPVKLDEKGMSATSLKDIFENWNEEVDGKKPHMMYTVTLGQNPSGTIMPLSRKKEIYALCHRHDILIFEDEPYWSMQYNIPGYRGEDPSTDKLLSALAPSYLAIDTDGRVLSLQSFTKIFAPGSRLGWIVGQPALIDKLTLTTSGTTHNPSGFAQAAVAQIILREWNGAKGFTRWLAGLRTHYRTRRDVFCEVLAEGRDISAARNSVKDDTPAAEDTKVTRKRKRQEADDEGLSYANGNSKKTKIRAYDFDIPAAGMSVWIKLNLKSHPLAQSPRRLGEAAIVDRLWNHLVSKYKLNTIPGHYFNATPEVSSADSYLRMTFAAMAPEELRRAARLFAHGVKEFWEGEGWELPQTLDTEESTAPSTHGIDSRVDEDESTRLHLHHADQSKNNLDLVSVVG